MNQILKRGVSAMTIAVLLTGCGAPEKLAATAPAAETPTATQVTEVSARVIVDKAWIAKFLAGCEVTDGVPTGDYQASYDWLDEAGKTAMLAAMQKAVDANVQGEELVAMWDNAYGVEKGRIDGELKALNDLLEAEKRASDAANQLTGGQ